MEDIFSQIYKGNMWGNAESVSGPGSTVESTKVIAEELPQLISKFNVKTVLDAACGDFNWMRYVKLEVESFIGIDIVPELIKINNERYANNIRKFLSLDIAKDPLPKVDLIICRDCLVHHTFENIFAILRNFKASSAKYILMTTFTDHLENSDITTGAWRFLNFEKAPFGFPKPIYLINEKYQVVDKSLGLWELDSLPI